MNSFGIFFDFEKIFRSIPRAHLFENLRFDIFIGFIADFRFPTFENFQRKKKVSENVREEFLGGFFLASKNSSDHPEGTPF